MTTKINLIWAVVLIIVAFMISVVGVTASNNSKYKEQACFAAGKSIVWRSIEGSSSLVKECK